MSETQTVTIADFLLARIAEDESVAREAAAGSSSHWDQRAPGEGVVTDRTGSDVVSYNGWRYVSDATHIARHDPARVLGECEAKRRIIEFHKNWPVLVESPPEFTQDTDDLTSVTLRMSQQIAWMTEQRYRETFGTEPPTGPILRALALPYADHPDYRPEWRP